MPLSDDDRRQLQPGHRRPERLDEIRPGGRREYTLTIEEVAAILKTTPKTIRKLMRQQYEEDREAALLGREAKRVGLRALYVSERIRRITERELGEWQRWACTLSSRPE